MVELLVERAAPGARWFSGVEERPIELCKEKAC
jgi:hypothetical protein